MAKTKSITQRARAAAPYFRRAAEDRYVRQQLRDAIGRLRYVSRRISKERAAATEDKSLYRNLQAAAVSLRRAIRQIEEPSPPPKHRLRKALLMGIALAGGIALVKRSRSADERREQLSDRAGPAASSPEPAASPSEAVA